MDSTLKCIVSEGLAKQVADKLKLECREGSKHAKSRERTCLTEAGTYKGPGAGRNVARVGRGKRE